MIDSTCTHMFLTEIASSMFPEARSDLMRASYGEAPSTMPLLSASFRIL